VFLQVFCARFSPADETYSWNVTENTDANLVAAALRGDAESFSRLCERYYPALVAIAYSQLADRHLAEDAAQETLLAVYRDIARLKEPQRLPGWLTAICRNIAIDMVKARARQTPAGIEDCNGVSCPSRNEDDAVGTVREIILRLEPDMRDIIYLRYYSQMGYARIAQMLGVSEEAVNGKLRRARKVIHRQLHRRISKETEP
jgi:RNA polymerase sigma factor (sigma-70 family)